MNMKLKRPESMDVRSEAGPFAVETGEVTEYLAHCDAFAFFLCRSFTLWGAKRKFKRYLEVTGAATDELETQTT
jgi:hypothetical protein